MYDSTSSICSSVSLPRKLCIGLNSTPFEIAIKSSQSVFERDMIAWRLADRTIQFGYPALSNPSCLHDNGGSSFHTRLALPWDSRWRSAQRPRSFPTRPSRSHRSRSGLSRCQCLFGWWRKAYSYLFSTDNKNGGIGSMDNGVRHAAQ